MSLMFISLKCSINFMNITYWIRVWRISYLHRGLPGRLYFTFFSNININSLYLLSNEYIWGNERILLIKQIENIWNPFLFLISSILCSPSSRQSLVQYRLMLSLNPQRQVSLATAELSLLHCLHLKPSLEQNQLILYSVSTFIWQLKSKTFCSWK